MMNADDTTVEEDAQAVRDGLVCAHWRSSWLWVADELYLAKVCADCGLIEQLRHIREARLWRVTSRNPAKG